MMLRGLLRKGRHQEEHLCNHHQFEILGFSGVNSRVLGPSNGVEPSLTLCCAQGSVPAGGLVEKA